MQVLKKILLSKYLLLFIFLLVIIISYYRVNLDKESFYKGSELEFNLTVLDKEYKDNRYKITFKGKEKLISFTNDFLYNIGDIVYVKGNLLKAKNNTIPNTFNYQKYLQSRGILWELNISDIKLIKGNSNIINKFKSLIVNHINNYKYSEYLYVFLLGDTSYFENDVRDIYTTCGLTYLISLGSFQVLLITNLLKYFEGKLKIKKNKSLIINILVITCYIFWVESVGVLRSGFSFIISSFLKHYKIKYKYHNIIFLIGIFLLLINPYYIINIGFLYSFTISIFISLNRKIIKGNYFKKLLIISLLAFISSLPITIYCNYGVNFLSCIYSLLFVPIFHFILFPLSVIIFIFSFLSPVYYFIISFLEYILNIISKIDISVLLFRKPSMLIVIIYYIVIFICIHKRKMIIIFIILLFIHNNINLIINEKLVTFLDVNQGDSIVIKNNNHLFLLDTGGNIYKSYSESIIKYIKSFGIGKIEAILLSHGDFDHMGEAINLVNNFKVEKVIFNCGSYNDLEKELIEVLDKKKIPYYSCIDKLDNLYFLKTKEYSNENDNSNVIYTELDGYKFMFMGDASTTTEKEILDKYNLHNIDVIKVGHHGSKTSSSNEFIKKINPKYSIISVGKNNRYGHPNKEVLNNLENSKIYRTDEDGSIMFKIKNNKLKIKKCQP